MRDQLEKAINLAKKTGDRLIVFDNARSEAAYVLMSLEEYEKLIVDKSEVRGLTEDELLDKINRDIAIWKSEQTEVSDEDESDENEATGGFFSKPKKLDYFSQKAAQIRKEESRPEEVREIMKQKRSNSWTIPSEIKEGAEEIIESDNDEERQYLEEVPF